jgi:pimeloyl-ACP methyl ester carboxylesterase
MDALEIPRARCAGYDWGGRAACVAAALWPDRRNGIVSVNGYLIQDIAAAMTPIRPDLEAGLWYFSYFLTERPRRPGDEQPRDPPGDLDAELPRLAIRWATLQRAAAAFDNPDYVEVVLRVTVPAIPWTYGGWQLPGDRRQHRTPLHRATRAPRDPGRRTQPSPRVTGRVRRRHPGTGEPESTTARVSGQGHARNQVQPDPLERQSAGDPPHKCKANVLLSKRDEHPVGVGQRPAPRGNQGSGTVASSGEQPRRRIAGRGSLRCERAPPIATIRSSGSRCQR